MIFKPVKQDRIAVAIVNQLKAAILSGRFKPGERMPTERELTQQFQVSRVVVREAIRELEIKGFVKILQGPSGGAYVTDLSFDQINNAFLDLFHSNKLSVAELIQTRILVECEIARLAAGRAGAEDRHRLQAALAAGHRVLEVLDRHDEIPEAARILVVANLFDLMCAYGGPGGDGLPVTQVLVDLGRSGEGLFDAKVIEALLVAHRNGTLYQGADPYEE